jgi:hypothetical protein
MYKIRWETNSNANSWTINLWPKDNHNSSLCICEYHHMCVQFKGLSQCCESIGFLVLKQGIQGQVFVTQRRAHIFLLESSEIIEYLNLSFARFKLKFKLWKNTLEKKKACFEVDMLILLFLKSWQVSSISKLNINFYYIELYMLILIWYKFQNLYNI